MYVATNIHIVFCVFLCMGSVWVVNIYVNVCRFIVSVSVYISVGVLVKLCL